MSKPYKTYWDLSEKERVDLPEADFKRYCQIALMEAGCPILPEKPKRPELAPLEPIKTETWIEYGGLLFAKIEDAVIAQGLRPYQETFAPGLSYREKVARPVMDPPKQIVVLNSDEVSARTEEIKERRSIEERYEQELADWNKLNDEAATALAHLYEDREEIYEKARTYRRIVASLKEYTELAGGDRDIAINFLKKRFTDEDEIKAALEWYGEEENISE